MGFKSDHAMITLTLETTKYKRGRGFWKLNCSLLQDKNYKITELNVEYNRYKSEEILSQLEETKTLFSKKWKTKQKGQ